MTKTETRGENTRSSASFNYTEFRCVLPTYLFLCLFRSLSLNCLLCLLHYNVVSPCRGFVTTELVSL